MKAISTRQRSATGVVFYGFICFFVFFIRRVWRRDNSDIFDEACTMRTRKFGGGKGIMVWGAVGGPNQENKLGRFGNNVNGDEYHKMIEAVFPVGRATRSHRYKVCHN